MRTTSPRSADLLVGLKCNGLVGCGTDHVRDTHLLKQRLILQGRVAPCELRCSGHGSLPHLAHLGRILDVELRSAAQGLGESLDGSIVELSFYCHLAVRPNAIHAILNGVLEAACWCH